MLDTNKSLKQLKIEDKIRTLLWNETMSVEKLSKKSNIPRTTLYRYLNPLIRKNYVIKDRKFGTSGQPCELKWDKRKQNKEFKEGVKKAKKKIKEEIESQKSKEILRLLNLKSLKENEVFDNIGKKFPESVVNTISILWWLEYEGFIEKRYKITKKGKDISKK